MMPRVSLRRLPWTASPSSPSQSSMPPFPLPLQLLGLDYQAAQLRWGWLAEHAGMGAADWAALPRLLLRPLAPSLGPRVAFAAHRGLAVVPPTRCQPAQQAQQAQQERQGQLRFEVELALLASAPERRCVCVWWWWCVCVVVVVCVCVVVVVCVGGWVGGCGCGCGCGWGGGAEEGALR
jgi:hypothetical protein